MDLDDLRIIRKRLVAELARVDALISEFDALAAKYAPELLSKKSPPPATFKTRPPSVPKLSKVSRPSPMGNVTADAAAARMEKLGRPLSLGEVVQAAVDAGVPVPKNKSALGDVVGSRIRRSGRFHSIPGQGWWFNDRPLPNENGALNGHTASAPDAGGVAAPPNESDTAAELFR